MQVAEVLSDLTSLRACGYNEALALVNVHKTTTASASTAESQQPSDQHAELSRAQELVDLHYGVKVKHMGTAPNSEPVVDPDLRRAREDVNRVLSELDG